MGSASKPYQREPWLRREYVEKNRSLRDIAEQFGVTKTPVYRFVQKYDLPAKPRGEWFECNYCGEEFYKMPSEIADGEGKHCSLECKHKNHRMEFECEYCGEEFELYKSDAEQYSGRFCSWECRYDSLKEEVECYWCAQPVEKTKNYLEKVERTFCSEGCRSEWLKTRTGEDAPAWNGGYGYRGENWNEQKRKALERDGFACVYCGRDREALGRHPDVHHIIPQVRWDDLEASNALNNLICVCRDHHTTIEGWNLAPPTRS